MSLPSPTLGESLSPNAITYLAQWATQFDNIIYKKNGTVNPGFSIDNESVEHIRETVLVIVKGLLDLRASSLAALIEKTGKVVPRTCEYMVKDATDMVERYAPTIKKNKLFSKPHQLHSLLYSVIKECWTAREKEKKDREREREMERMTLYINCLCDVIVDDILKWTGNYVKNIRCGEMKINLPNLKIAMHSDRPLLELTNFVVNDDDNRKADDSFLDQIRDFSGGDDLEESPKVTYEAIAREFLHDEKQFDHQLMTLNVFRKRLYEVCEDKNLLGMLFGNFSDLHEITMKVVRLLEDAIEMSDSPSVGFGIWDLAEEYEFDSYLSYVVRDVGETEEPFISVCEEAIHELLTNPKHAHIFEQGTEYIDGKTFRSIVRHVLPSLLQAPVVHFYHYSDFVSRLMESNGTEEDKLELKNTKGYLVKRGTLLKRLVGPTIVLKALITADREQRRTSQMSQVQRFQEIEMGIDGFEGHPIGKTCQQLVKEGELTMMRPSYTSGLDTPLKGRWQTTRYIYLFDQLLVLTKKHRSPSLKFKDRTATQLMTVRDLEDAHGLNNAFRIEISGKAAPVVKVFTFACKTPEDKASWMLALVRTATKSLVDRQVDYNEKEEFKKHPLVIPTPEQYRFSEPDCEDNITYEDYTTSSGVPVVQSATVPKLVERLTFHTFTDNKFLQTFLISYRSFCSPTDLLDLLIERFNVPTPLKLQQDNRGGPLAGRYDTVQSHGLSSANSYALYSDHSLLRFRKEYERPIQRNVLSVMMQWVKNHWYDFSADSELLSNLQKFLQQMAESNGKLTKQHKKYCRNILANIDKQLAKNSTDGHANPVFSFDESATQRMPESPTYNHFHSEKPEVLWHTAKQGDISNYDLLTLHPIEIGRQLTLLHFDLYRSVKPIELVDAAWTKHDKYVKSPQLLKLTDHTNLLTYWVSRSIVESDSLEERTAMFARVIEVMSVFEELHNFTGFVAFRSAIQSAAVFRLESCWAKLSSGQTKRYAQMEKLCDARWTALQQRLRNINPPCIPFCGQYLSNIFFLEASKKTFVGTPSTAGQLPAENLSTVCPKSKPKKVLVSFFKCRRISNIISEIQMYQNQAYTFQTEPTIRQFFESINPKSEFGNDNDKLEEYLFNRSRKVEPKNEPPLDLKPKHAPHVLKSPGIKAPKTSHSHTPSYSTQTSTVPSTPNFDIEGPKSPKSAVLTSPPSDMRDQQRTGDVSDIAAKAAQFGLMPPPTPPRKKKPSSSPSVATAPLLPSVAGTPPPLPRRTSPPPSVPIALRKQPIPPPPTSAPPSPGVVPAVVPSAQRKQQPISPPAECSPSKTSSPNALQKNGLSPSFIFPELGSGGFGKIIKEDSPVKYKALELEMMLPGVSQGAKDMHISKKLPPPPTVLPTLPDVSPMTSFPYPPEVPTSPVPPPPAGMGHWVPESYIVAEQKDESSDPPPLPPRMVRRSVESGPPQLPPKTYKQVYSNTVRRTPQQLPAKATTPPPLPPKSYKYQVL